MYQTSFAFDSVAVIESLGGGELRTGREVFESHLAPASVTDSGFVSSIYEVSERREFFGALRDIIEESERYGRSPIIDIEAHGDERGITLLDGGFITWAEVAPQLARINELSRMNLLVIAAMCHGLHMCDILKPVERAPAFGIIGADEIVPAGVLLDSLRRFYDVLLGPGKDLREALNAANLTQDVKGWRLRLMNAELMLCRVFSWYVESLATEESNTARANRMVADLVRARELTVDQSMLLREAIRRDLDDHERWFQHYRSHFLMVDLFPENDTRFGIAYEDCVS